MISRYNLGLALHLAFGILAASSPFWISWKIILIGIVLFYVQHFLYGRCLLTTFQFKGKDVDFVHYYLKKFGFNFPRKKVAFVVTYILPFLILTTALIRQVILVK